MKFSKFATVSLVFTIFVQLKLKFVVESRSEDQDQVVRTPATSNPPSIPVVGRGFNIQHPSMQFMLVLAW